MAPARASHSGRGRCKPCPRYRPRGWCRSAQDERAVGKGPPGRPPGPKKLFGARSAQVAGSSARWGSREPCGQRVPCRPCGQRCRGACCFLRGCVGCGVSARGVWGADRSVGGSQAAGSALRSLSRRPLAAARRHRCIWLSAFLQRDRSPAHRQLGFKSSCREIRRQPPSHRVCDRMRGSSAMLRRAMTLSPRGRKTFFEWTIMFRCTGSVFPLSMAVALPNAVIAGIMQWIWPNGSMSLFGEDGGILTQTIVWSGFTFLLGFLVVFRTSQSYARWWEGCSACHYMRAEWFNVCRVRLQRSLSPSLPVFSCVWEGASIGSAKWGRYDVRSVYFRLWIAALSERSDFGQIIDSGTSECCRATSCVWTCLFILACV